MRKENAKAFKAMEKDAEEFDKTLSAIDKPEKDRKKSKIAQMQDALRDVQTQGRITKRDSGKWISPELNKRLDAAIRKNQLLGRTLRDTFNGADLNDPEVKKALASLDKQLRVNIKEMTVLSREAEKTSATMKKKLADGVDRANVRLLEQRHRVTDLRGEFTKMKSAAKAIGDDDFAAKMDDRLKKLQTVLRDYDKDIVNVTKGTEEWHKRTTALSQSLNGLTLTSGKDNDILKEKVHLYEQTVKESKAVSKETEKLETRTKHVTTATRNLGNEMKKTEKKGNFLTRGFSKLGTKMSGSFRRMDSTVRLVIALIAVAGNLAAGLGSGLSAAMVGIASAAVLAAAALSPLLGILAPLAYGFILLKKSFTDKHGNPTLDKVKKMAPEAGKALEGLGKVIKKIDAGALFKEWNISLAKFADTLAHSLEFDKVAQGIGKAFAKVTDGLTEVLKSGAWKDFVGAVEGPLTTAMGNFGAALGPLLSTLLQFFTAAAPFAVILSEQFLEWAKALEAAFGESVKSGEFQKFMELAITALDSVLDLIGAVGDALGTVFKAGAPSGIKLLDMITGMVDAFNEWATSTEGQKSLKDWFDQGFKIMKAVFDLLGDLGIVLGDLVTPAVVDDLVQFLGAVSDILPVLGDVLNIIGQAHILDIFTQAIKLIGDAITPLVGPMGDFLALLSDQVLRILESMSPAFQTLGTALGEVFTALSPLLPVLGDLIVSLVDALAPILPVIANVLVDALNALIPFVIELVKKLAPILPDLVDGILAIVEAMAPFIVQLIEGIGPILPTIADLIVLLAGAIGDMLPFALEILIPLMENLVTILPTLNTFLEALIPLFQLLPQIIIILTPLLEMMANIFEQNITLIFGLINVVITVITWFTNLITSVSNVASRIADFVTNDPLLKWFQNLMGVGDTTFKSLGDAASAFADAVTASFKWAVNGIVDMWNNTIGKLNWTIPGWVPKVGGHTISGPKLTHWNAAGGIADRPTIGGFGEAGPEALVPLDRPLNQVNPAVRELSAFAQGKMGPSISEGAIVINTPATNGRVIAESVLDRIVSYSR